jgi:RNA polymerase sigma factor (sigma-70 family)
MVNEQLMDLLLERALNGSKEALGDLYRLLAPSVTGYLRAQGATEPDDLCSEVFIGVLRNLSGFTGGTRDFRSWVFSVAHRRIIDERRYLGRRTPAVPLDEAAERAGLLPPSRRDAQSEADDRMGTDRVLEICAALSPDQRDVLLLRLVCDLSIDQIAEVLTRSPGSVKALQRRALASVARNFSSEGVPL